MEIATLLENTSRQLMDAIPTFNQLDIDTLATIGIRMNDLKTLLAETISITQSRMATLEENNRPHSIVELIRATTRSMQRERLRRCLNTENDGDKEFFVVGVEEGANESKVVTIRGTANANGIRNDYKVVVKKDGLHCSCPDTNHACREHHLVCKHICFVVVRIGRLLPLYFFNADGKNKGILVQSDLQKLLTILADRVALSHFSAECALSQVANTFLPDVDAISDVCPICYEDTPPREDIESLACCPQCKHTMHVTCVNVWLHKSKTCVVCRYDGWKSFHSA